MCSDALHDPKEDEGRAGYDASACISVKDAHCRHGAGEGDGPRGVLSGLV